MIRELARSPHDHVRLACVKDVAVAADDGVDVLVSSERHEVVILARPAGRLGRR